MATDGPRSYTDEQKAQALKLHAEHGPAEAARQLGIPNGTVKAWARRAGVRGPGAASVREAVEVAALSWSRRRAELTDDFGTAAAEFLAKARDSGNPIAVERLTRACCALVEKAELLSGGATSRLDVSDEERRARVRALRDELSPRRQSKQGAQG